MTTAHQSAQDTITLIKRFEDSFNRHDPDALMADMTEDCIFEHVAPEGKGLGRYEGYDQVRAFWAAMPETMPNYRFETEDLFATGNRGTYRWTLRFDLPDGGVAEYHGVDVYTIRDGKISEKYTYFTM